MKRRHDAYKGKRGFTTLQTIVMVALVLLLFILLTVKIVGFKNGALGQ